ncbi:MAG: hypothetical protein COT92_03565 [Candidatus Doudnabacteria bacterium CG10_big_fil_rev_8_21_14_0_10_42_18]|uniref:Thioredoxin-like fold domain-containing protein n=1 Tax=Candidatus Doudnabacteria bacterium CG10_big_fil_rev_8_21_14_0_10_42_18 TaxID=1974552 RepID=A0A2H0VA57_9BACT|nr:MAG: hypothetical protein COT92_03565 [Candidatus Doudnabacteria bacterium CG10_big_fil_rev_8_21_14_0_10_42_18]
MLIKNKKFIILFFLVIMLSACSFKKQAMITKENNQLSSVPEKKIHNEMTVPLISANDHVRGTIDAPVTIIVYSDFECLFCARFENEDGSVARADAEFGDKLRWVFRHYPLPFNAQAIKAAEASECASEQDKFWEMHDLLFFNSSANQLNTLQFKQNAVDLGLDSAQFNTCLDTDKYYDKVVQAIVLANDLGIRSAPHFFVNGHSIIGALSYEDYDTDYGREKGLKTIITEELQKANN